MNRNRKAKLIYAPYVKKQPKDVLEVVLSAGSDCWTLAKALQEQPLDIDELTLGQILPEDSAPVIVLDNNVLSKIENYLIAPISTKKVVIYKAGELSNEQISQICINLSLNNPHLLKAELRDDKGALLEDLSEYINRLRNNPNTQETAQIILTANTNTANNDDGNDGDSTEKQPIISDERPKASSRARHFREWLNVELARHRASKEIYQYNGKIWQPLDEIELGYELAKYYDENGIGYSANALKAVIDTVRYQIPLMGEPGANYIAFNNGVLNRNTYALEPHHKDLWLTAVNQIGYCENVTNTPNFNKWLDWIADGKAQKKLGILGAFYAIFTNRYDWQLFLEVTGDGGSGKTVFSQIAELLVGRENTCSIDLHNLDDDRKRASIFRKSLIICPDQARYVGDGSGLKAIAGGDLINIDPKHKDPFSAVIKAIVLITNNQGTRFTERSGGIERRRVIFHFNRVVPNNERDYSLMDKIKQELSGIIKMILTTFKEPKQALNALMLQMNSEEARGIKEKSDPVTAFCRHLTTTQEVDGLSIGTATKADNEFRRYLYIGYLLFLRANNNQKPLSLNSFSDALTQGLKQHGAPHPFTKKRTNSGYKTNAHYKNINDFSAEFYKQV